MTAATVVASGGTGSALPGKRVRAKKHPAEKRNQDRAVMMKLEADGSFRAANEEARQWLKAQRFHIDERVVAYFYRVRDEAAFRKAHRFAKLLRENTPAFDGLTDHEVLKKLQVDHGIACVRQKMLLPKAAQQTFGVTHMQVLTPRSLAPGFMDEGEWQAVWHKLANAAAEEYFGSIDAAVVDELLKLMPRDPA